jgi:hypothetical protein
MWQPWERGKTCAGFWREIPRERDNLKEQGVDGIRMDLGEIGWECMEWIHLVQDMDRWRGLLNAVMNLRDLAPRI